MWSRLIPCFLSAAVHLPGLPAAEGRLSVWNEKVAERWWGEHEGAEEWLAGAERLQAAMLNSQAQVGLDRALGNQHFIRWAMHLRWISLLPRGYSEHEYFSLEENRIQFRELGRRPELVALVSGAIVPDDDGVKVAEILCRIAAAHGEDFDEYRNLAVALAVVADVAPPDGWPHPYVGREAIPVGDLDPAVRFGFYVDSHRAGKLLFDPRGLAVHELCFVVDTVLELRELAYAQQIDISGPGKLEDLYFAVKYDSGRIHRQRYQWPHGRYRLIDVGTKGGICADQAYFVAHAGKAMGVPTLIFLGQGLSGTHAWLGFLERRGAWDFEAARSRGEKYPAGAAYDPQTWRRVTDAQLEMVIDDSENVRSLQESRRILQWAMLNPEAPFFREVVARARRSMPRSVEAWRLEADWLASHESDAKVDLKFWGEWVRAFDRERDLKIEGQKNLLRCLEKAGDARGAERLRKQVVTENRSARFDLGISLAADAVFASLAGRDWEAAAREYESVMRRFKRKAGGHLFYTLVQPYVNACLQERQFEMAERAVATLVDEFNPQRGSILDNDLRKLISAVEGAD